MLSPPNIQTCRNAHTFEHLQAPTNKVCQQQHPSSTTWHISLGICSSECENTFTPQLWLMFDQSFCNPRARVVDAHVMEKIILETLLACGPLDHCGMLLCGCSFSYITHTYVDTCSCVLTHKGATYKHQNPTVVQMCIHGMLVLLFCTVQTLRGGLKR